MNTNKTIGDGGMARARFVISDTVQDVGCRAIITEKICNTPGLEGAPRNLPDGRVEVLLKGEEEDIKKFFEELKIELSKRLDVSPNPGIEFSELEFNDELVIPDTMRASQGLLVGQLCRGIELLNELPRNMAKELKKILR